MSTYQQYINTSVDDLRITIQNENISSADLLKVREDIKDSEGQKTRLKMVEAELKYRGVDYE